jgi:hypothetical protein
MTLAIQYFETHRLFNRGDFSQDQKSVLTYIVKRLSADIRPEIVACSLGEKVRIVTEFLQEILSEGEKRNFDMLRKLFKIPAELEPSTFKLACVRDLRGWKGPDTVQTAKDDPPFSLDWTKERLFDYLSMNWFKYWRSCTIIIGELVLEREILPSYIETEVLERMVELNMKHIPRRRTLSSYIARRGKIASVVPTNILPRLLICETAAYDLTRRISSRVNGTRIVKDWEGLIAECHLYQKRAGKLDRDKLDGAIQEFTTAAK